MKKLVQVTEVEDEGLMSLMGQRVLLMCAGYFYEGKLVGINESCVQIEDPHIVYSTGPWDDRAYAYSQKLHAKFWYISIGLIESFGVSKNG